MSAVTTCIGASAPVDFDARIAPLFQEHCVDCHAADDPDGEFALDTFAALMKGGKGGKAIVAGNAQESLLVKFLEGRSGVEGKNQFMPPGKKEHLKPEEIAIIRQWIDGGALPPATPAKPADVLSKLPKIAVKPGMKNAIQTLAYSPKAKLVAAGMFGSVHLLNPQTREVVRKLDGVAGKVNALAFSADGTQLFAAAGDAGINGVAYQWKVADGTLVRKFEGHTDAIYGLTLSPDGQTLATGSYDQKIKLWSIASGAETITLAGHNGAVFGLSFRPDGKVLASASADRTVKLWEMPTGKRLDTFSQPLKEQTVVSFSPDGKTVAAGGVDNRIRIWSVSARALEGTNKLLQTRYAHEGGLLSLVYAADGKSLVTSAADRTVKIWNAADIKELHLLEKQSDWSPGLAILDTGKLVVGRLDGNLALYDATTGEPEAKPMAKAAPKALPPAKPELARMEPRGVQSGSTTRIKITGKGLKDLKAVKLAHQGMKAAIISVNPAGTMAEVDIIADKETPRSQVNLSLVTPSGESAPMKLLVDYLPQIIIAKSAEPTLLQQLPVNVWGTLAEIGQVDSVRFAAKKGQTVVLDMAARRVDSKATSPRVEILSAEGRLLAANNGLDSGSDPFIAFTAPNDGAYTVHVRQVTLDGSADHFYRLSIGELPYVTGWWPLSVPAGTTAKVHLVGHNLPADATVEVDTAKAETDTITLPLDSDGYRSRVSMMVTVSKVPEQLEAEPNDALEKAQALPGNISVNGRLLNSAGPDEADVDHYRIDAEKGQEFIIETRAAMLGSPADTKVEVLNAKGEPVPMMTLQATKDSWITLRSEDANDPAVRLGQFSELELNDYMYFNGEVLKVFRLARGPDADTIYYANGGKRRAYLNTSPAAHGLDDYCYAVQPVKPGAKLVANGLPVFHLYYANDDDGERELGRDSRLSFVAPAKGSYILRVSDTRSWSGERFAYRLMVRPPVRGYTAALRGPAMMNVPSGTGLQFAVSVNRQDGWEGDVRVDISGVPAGFYVSNPLTIEPGHLESGGAIFAHPNTVMGPHDFSKVKITATATVDGKEVTRDLGAFPKVTVTAAPKRALFMEPDLAGKPAGDGKTAPMKPYEITIAPGSTVSAWLRVERRGDDALLGLDVENLPHGVIVDNIGLNGVQIRAGENVREITLACAKWVPEHDRLCHMVVGNARNDAVKSDGAQTSLPVLLKIRKPAPVAANAP
jgi:mono/diheme cytochrome c family protein/sugar lactone lactonase YvrE